MDKDYGRTPVALQECYITLKESVYVSMATMATMGYYSNYVALL